MYIVPAPWRSYYSSHVKLLSLGDICNIKPAGGFFLSSFLNAREVLYEFFHRKPVIPHSNMPNRGTCSPRGLQKSIEHNSIWAEKIYRKHKSPKQPLIIFFSAQNSAQVRKFIPIYQDWGANKKTSTHKELRILIYITTGGLQTYEHNFIYLRKNFKDNYHNWELSLYQLGWQSHVFVYWLVKKPRVLLRKPMGGGPERVVKKNIF